MPNHDLAKWQEEREERLRIGHCFMPVPQAEAGWDRSVSRFFAEQGEKCGPGPSFSFGEPRDPCGRRLSERLWGATVFWSKDDVSKLADHAARFIRAHWTPDATILIDEHTRFPLAAYYPHRVERFRVPEWCNPWEDHNP